MSFNPSLPLPYKENWREAYRSEKDDSPRLSTYQAPGGDPLPFVFESFELSGGQTLDTAAYPFFGLWSNDPLNEEPQVFTVSGYIRGDAYIAVRNAMVEALRVRTDDDTPGFLDLPLWGRFPIVVGTYKIKEKGAQNGQCALSITCTRAGVTTEERQDSLGSVEGITDQAADSFEKAAVDQFEKSLKGVSASAVLASDFGKMAGGLRSITGRVQGAQSTLNKMTNSVLGVTTLIAQGILIPRSLAQAVFGAAAGIVSGIFEIKNAAEGLASYFGIRDNKKNALLQFLSQRSYTSDTPASTVSQFRAKAASDNLYRSAALYSAARIMARLEDTTYQQGKHFWALYETLQDSVDQGEPEVYRAAADLRIAAARELSATNLAVEMSKSIHDPSPLLYVSNYLSCPDHTLRRLNPYMSDSFVIKGEVAYV